MGRLAVEPGDVVPLGPDELGRERGIDGQRDAFASLPAVGSAPAAAGFDDVMRDVGVGGRGEEPDHGRHERRTEGLQLFWRPHRRSELRSSAGSQGVGENVVWCYAKRPTDQQTTLTERWACIIRWLTLLAFNRQSVDQAPDRAFRCCIVRLADFGCAQIMQSQVQGALLVERLRLQFP